MKIKNHFRLMDGLILFSWIIISIILGISYRFDYLSKIISIEIHPIFTLVSTPLILVIHSLLTKKAILKIEDKIKIKNLQASLNLFLILGVLTYIIGLGVKVGFLPFIFHQILAVIFSLFTLKVSLSLIFSKD